MSTQGRARSRFESSIQNPGGGARGHRVVIGVDGRAGGAFGWVLPLTALFFFWLQACLFCWNNVKMSTSHIVD